jgi:hypothetical protein
MLPVQNRLGKLFHECLYEIVILEKSERHHDSKGFLFPLPLGADQDECFIHQNIQDSFHRIQPTITKLPKDLSVAILDFVGRRG